MVRQIPLEDFFKKPEKIFVQLSPNGKYISYMEPWERRLNLFVTNLETDEVIQLTRVTERDIQMYLWANDERIIYIQDSGGDENTKLFAINHDGSNQLDLTPFENVRCSIVDDLEDINDYILFNMNKRNEQLFDVYRLNVFTGEMEMIAENPGNIISYLTDHNGALRVGVASDGVNNTILYRKTEKDDWNPVATYNFKESANPIYFTFDNQALYVASNVGQDKYGIFEYDLKTGKEGKLVFEHQEVDVHDLMISKKRKKITGVAFEKEYRHFVFFDDTREKIHQFLEDQLPNIHKNISSFNKDENRCVVRTYSDRSLGSYYLLNLDKWELKKLFDIAPWIDEKEMSETKPIQLQSRDELTLHGYLTLPQGSNEKNLPMIIIPHGGPYGVRTSWGFDSNIQFLANRGFAVIQINFRGSGGYGRHFQELGYKQWGKTMQNDLTDAVQWAIDQGIADPKKVAISGASYGGYAVLAGLAFTPDLYACGIDYVGPANLFTLLNSIPPYWEPMRAQLYEEVGSPEDDEELLREISPVFHAEKIKAPLFVAQGANDPRVKQAESDQIVAVLRERGVEVEYMVKENEGHGFDNEENQFDFYRATEKFLLKHIEVN